MEVDITRKKNRRYSIDESRAGKLNWNIIVEKKSSSSVVNVSYEELVVAFQATFLPAGYPHSVRPEYISYQFWDSLQALSSYLRSVLTTKSLLGK